MKMNGIQSVKVHNQTVAVQFICGQVIEFEDIWLRNECRCSTCYSSDLFQRSLHLLDIPDSHIVNIEFDREKICITWNDDHKSTYAAKFLEEFDYTTWVNSRRMKPILWRGNEVANKITRIQVDKFLTSVDGAKSVFQSLLEHGLVLIENVEPTIAATEIVCKALGGVQHTFFGGMWFVNNNPDHADLAYLNVPLAAHTDNTYFTEAAGLQVFHCIEHMGTGGETLLVDGFYGAIRLREEFPEDYNFLSNFDVSAEFMEKGRHYRESAPVIVTDKNKDIKQIRFNVNDRSSMAFATRSECRSFYRSMKSLSRYYEDRLNQWHVKLKPGMVLAFDNFRILHGRTGYTGKRVLCGSYVSRSDWLNKARALCLIK